MALRRGSTGDWGFVSISPFGPVWHPAGPSSTSYAVIGAADYDGDGLTDLAFRNGAGDWGYMSIGSGGGEIWHAVGPTSTDYAAW